MGKQNTKSTTAKAVVLSPEEFQKLTPEEQVDYLNAVLEKNTALESEVKAAKKEAKEAKPKELPTFTVEKGGENFEAGEYQFQYPTFTWDDNTIINVHELMADAEGEDEKVAAKAQTIISALVARQSGCVKRKED